MGGAHSWRASGRRPVLGRVTVAATVAVVAGSFLAGVGSAAPTHLQAPVGSQAPVFRDVPVPGTPCTAAARACVDTVGGNAWLIERGRVIWGPVPAALGDAEDPTPRGTFRVEWKAEQYTSREFLVQMPYAVFFAPGGVAFHEGNQETNSAGCVKLRHEDAVAFFDYLLVGDQVQVR